MSNVNESTDAIQADRQKFETLMQLVSNLLRDASLQQRQAAASIVWAGKLTKAQVEQYPHSRIAVETRNLIESGDGVKIWLQDQLNSLCYGMSAVVSLRGVGGLWYSGRSDGKPISERGFAHYLQLSIGWYSEAIEALQSVGVVDKGCDDLDKAFEQCGGSVSYL